ncbi:hypothetical protein ACOMHN_028705 [Nucella lapillus]
MSLLDTSKFAQRLAANEQTRRDRAIKKLRKYIGAKTAKAGGFSEEELLQLWKGLHYCFWMQDKPLLQEELSTKLCSLLKAFPDTGSSLEFAAVFFTTQAKEWGRLDQWRMNKFMMLIRDFLNATLEVVRHGQWKESGVQTLSALIGEVMDAGKEDLPDGFRMHLADILLEEMEKVGAGELTGDHINILLDPFVQYIVHSKRDTIADSIIKKVFGPILQAARTAEDEAPKLQFNFRGLQQRLFDAGRQKEILPKVRRKIYHLVKLFSDLGLEGTEPPNFPEQQKASGVKRKHTEEEGGQPEEKKTKKKGKRGTGKGREADSPAKKQKKEKGTPQSTPKQVVFDLERNSSRGLREFVKSSASGSSPYLPSRSPSQGILKGSPGVIPSPSSGPTPAKAGRKRHKLFTKGQSPKQQQLGTRREQKVGAKRHSKGNSPKGEKPSKFASRKKGKVMKKPKRR